MSRRQNFKRKKKMPTWATILIGVLTLALLGGAITVCSAFGVLQERNENNLLKVDDTYIKSQSLINGIELDVMEDGAIHIHGDPSNNATVIIQQVKLSAGTYTISGIEKLDTGKMMLCVVYGSGSSAIAGDSSATFTLTEEETVSVELHFVKDAEIHYANRIIRPVLVEGDEVGEFYA